MSSTPSGAGARRFGGVTRWVWLTLTLHLCVAPTAAQEPLRVEDAPEDDVWRPTSLDYPDRAMALRPAGMVETALTWGTDRHDFGFGEGCEEHLWVASVDARVPIDELVLEASYLQATYYTRYDEERGDGYDGTYVRGGGPRLGASIRYQGDVWRGEVGGALGLPLAWDEAPDLLLIDRSFGAPDFAFVPDAFHYTRHRGGWNAFQLSRGRLALVAHTRWEVDPAPEVVLGVELDLPVVVKLEGEDVMVLPQIALEGAWRFWRASVLGLRAQLVTIDMAYSSGETGEYGAVALLEPFVRVAADEPHAAPFATAALQITLGPDQATSFTSSSACAALFGLKVGGGVLF